MDKLDVSIKFYPETTKGHEIGTILFRGDLAMLLGTERIELIVDAEAIYFQKSRDGHGLRLNNSRIQLWSLAWIAKNWEGEYPLVFDIEKGCYKVMACDRKEEVKNQGIRLGIPVQYTPHKHEPKPVVIAPEITAKSFNDQEKLIMNTLLDTLIDSDDVSEMRSIAITIKSLLKGGKNETLA